MALPPTLLALATLVISLRHYTRVANRIDVFHRVTSARLAELLTATTLAAQKANLAVNLLQKMADERARRTALGWPPRLDDEPQRLEPQPPRDA